tara:strand:- start:314 stop:979 length:666 start_codon:yes stop_codon:yes gene_type:complete
MKLLLPIILTASVFAQITPSSQIITITEHNGREHRNVDAHFIENFSTIKLSNSTEIDINNIHSIDVILSKYDAFNNTIGFLSAFVIFIAREQVSYYGIGLNQKRVLYAGSSVIALAAYPLLKSIKGTIGNPPYIIDYFNMSSSKKIEVMRAIFPKNEGIKVFLANETGSENSTRINKENADLQKNTFVRKAGYAICGGASIVVLGIVAWLASPKKRPLGPG